MSVMDVLLHCMIHRKNGRRSLSHPFGRCPDAARRLTSWVKLSLSCPTGNASGRRGISWGARTRSAPFSRWTGKWPTGTSASSWPRANSTWAASCPTSSASPPARRGHAAPRLRLRRRSRHARVRRTFRFGRRRRCRALDDQVGALAARGLRPVHVRPEPRAQPQVLPGRIVQRRVQPDRPATHPTRRRGTATSPSSSAC